jgi:hypothetical protein
MVTTTTEMAVISEFWQRTKKVVTNMASKPVDGARRLKQYGKNKVNSYSNFTTLVDSDIDAVTQGVAQVVVKDDGAASPLTERDANCQFLGGAPEEEEEEKERERERDREREMKEKEKGKKKRQRRRKNPFNRGTLRYLKPVLELGGHPTTFEDFAAVLEEQSIELQKVAEGSYAEVFELKRDGGAAILKLVPIKPERGETVMLLELAQMTSVSSLAAELVTLQRLQDIPGFSQFINFQVLCGKQAGEFIPASKAFRENGGRSEFPDPALPYAYDEDQLWCAIEMSHGGSELDKEIIDHPLIIWDVFWGVCFALAKAEVEIKFEVRCWRLCS